ncbi:polyamine transporter tpo5 [Lecanora helva]
MRPESRIDSEAADSLVDTDRWKDQRRFATSRIGQEVVDPVQLSDADRRLAEMGYIQVYKREFSWLSSISFALSISSLFGSVTTTFVYPLEAGGASSAVWCWLISGFGCYCIALSVAELVSAYPTSGGMYFTCKYLVPENWISEIAWLAGWLNLLGQVAGVAATEYGIAQLLLAAISMSNDFKRYLPTDRQTVGVMAASTVFHGALNCFNTSALEKITKSYLLFHVAVLIACVTTLLSICSSKPELGLHTSEYVWTEVVNNSGWRPNGWSWLFGFLSASWTMTDYDAIAHISEEIQEPEIKAPWSITIAIGASWIVGWLFNIVLAYTVGDPLDKLNSPVAQPVAQIFYEVMGRRPAVFFTVAAYVVQNFGALAAIQAASRTIWAFSRDEMLPLSRIWYKIDKRTQTPIYAVWLLTTCCVLINLVALGSYTAISAIFNLTAIALDWSYCIPIICKLSFGMAKRGPFHLGRASTPINCWAIVWTVLVTIIYVQPTIRPVTAQNMNYVSVLMVAVAIFAVGYWYAAGRYYYTGPRVHTQVLDSSEDDVMEGNKQRSSEVSANEKR